MEELGSRYVSMLSGSSRQLGDSQAVCTFVQRMEEAFELCSAPRKNFIIDTTTPHGDVIITESSAMKPGTGWVTMQVTESIRRGVHEWCIKIDNQGESTDGSGLMLGIVPKNFAKYDSFISQGGGWCLSRAGKFYGHWRRKDGNTMSSNLTFGTGDSVVFSLDVEAAKMTVRVGEKYVVGEISNLASEVFPAISLHYRHQHVRFDYHKIHDRQAKKRNWVDRNLLPSAPTHLPLSPSQLQRLPLGSYLFHPKFYAKSASATVDMPLLMNEKVAATLHACGAASDSSGTLNPEQSSGSPSRHDLPSQLGKARAVQELVTQQLQDWLPFIEYGKPEVALARMTIIYRALDATRQYHARVVGSPRPTRFTTSISPEELRRQQSQAHLQEQLSTWKVASGSAALNTGAVLLLHMFSQATSLGNPIIQSVVENVLGYLFSLPLYGMSELAITPQGGVPLSLDVLQLTTDNIVKMIERLMGTTAAPTGPSPSVNPVMVSNEDAALRLMELLLALSIQRGLVSDVLHFIRLLHTYWDTDREHTEVMRDAIREAPAHTPHFSAQLRRWLVHVSPQLTPNIRLPNFMNAFTALDSANSSSSPSSSGGTSGGGSSNSLMQAIGQRPLQQMIQGTRTSESATDELPELAILSFAVHSSHAYVHCKSGLYKIGNGSSGSSTEWLLASTQEPAQYCVGCNSSSLGATAQYVILCSDAMTHNDEANSSVLEPSEYGAARSKVRGDVWCVTYTLGLEVLRILRTDCLPALLVDGPCRFSVSSGAMGSVIVLYEAVSSESAHGQLPSSSSSAERLPHNSSSDANANAGRTSAKPVVAAASAAGTGAATSPTRFVMCFSTQTFPTHPIWHVALATTNNPQLSAPSSSAPYGLHFDRLGVADLGAPDNVLQTPGGHVTVEMWIKFMDREESATFYQHGDRTTSGEVFLETTNLGGSFCIQGGYRHESRGVSAVSAPLPPHPVPRFVHIALVFDGRWNLYINAEEAGFVKHGSHVALEHPRSRWTIGNGCVSVMAELRVWMVGRTQREVYRDYRRRLSGTEPGLVCCLPLTEPRGNVLYNQVALVSGDGRHGALLRNGRNLRCPDHPLANQCHSSNISMADEFLSGTNSNTVHSAVGVPLAPADWNRLRIGFTGSHLLVFQHEIGSTELTYNVIKDSTRLTFFDVHTGKMVFGEYLLKSKADAVLISCAEDGTYWALSSRKSRNGATNGGGATTSSSSSSAAEHLLGPVDIPKAYVQDPSQYSIARSSQISWFNSTSPRVRTIPEHNGEAITYQQQQQQQPHVLKVSSRKAPKPTLLSSHLTAAAAGDATSWSNCSTPCCVHHRPDCRELLDSIRNLSTPLSPAALSSWLLSVLEEHAEHDETDPVLFKPLVVDVSTQTVQQVTRLLIDNFRMVSSVTARRHSVSLKEDSSGRLIEVVLRVLLRLVRSAVAYSVDPNTMGLVIVNAEENSSSVLRRVPLSWKGSMSNIPVPQRTKLATPTKLGIVSLMALKEDRARSSPHSDGGDGGRGGGGGSGKKEDALGENRSIGFSLFSLLCEIVNCEVSAAPQLPPLIAPLAKAVLQEGMTLFLPDVQIRAALMNEMLSSTAASARTPAHSVVLNGVVRAFGSIPTASLLLNAPPPPPPGVSNDEASDRAQSNSSEQTSAQPPSVDALFESSLSLLQESKRLCIETLESKSHTGKNSEMQHEARVWVPSDDVRATRESLETMQILLLSFAHGSDSSAQDPREQTNGRNTASHFSTAVQAFRKNLTNRATSTGTAAAAAAPGRFSQTELFLFPRPTDACKVQLVKKYYSHLFSAAEEVLQCMRHSDARWSRKSLTVILDNSFMGSVFHVAMAAIPLLERYEDATWYLENMENLVRELEYTLASFSKAETRVAPSLQTTGTTTTESQSQTQAGEVVDLWSLADNRDPSSEGSNDAQSSGVLAGPLDLIKAALLYTMSWTASFMTTASASGEDAGSGNIQECDVVSVSKTPPPPPDLKPSSSASAGRATPAALLQDASTLAQISSVGSNPLHQRCLAFLAHPLLHGGFHTHWDSTSTETSKEPTTAAAAAAAAETGAKSKQVFIPLFTSDMRTSSVIKARVSIVQQLRQNVASPLPVESNNHRARLAALLEGADEWRKLMRPVNPVDRMCDDLLKLCLDLVTITILHLSPLVLCDNEREDSVQVSSANKIACAAVAVKCRGVRDTLLALRSRDRNVYAQVVKELVERCAIVLLFSQNSRLALTHRVLTKCPGDLARMTVHERWTSVSNRLRSLSFRSQVHWLTWRAVSVEECFTVVRDFLLGDLLSSTSAPTKQQQEETAAPTTISPGAWRKTMLVVLSEVDQTARTRLHGLEHILRMMEKYPMMAPHVMAMQICVNELCNSHLLSGIEGCSSEVRYQIQCATYRFTQLVSTPMDTDNSLVLAPQLSQEQVRRTSAQALLSNVRPCAALLDRVWRPEDFEFLNEIHAVARVFQAHCTVFECGTAIDTTRNGEVASRVQESARGSVSASQLRLREESPLSLGHRQSVPLVSTLSSSPSTQRLALVDTSSPSAARGVANSSTGSGGAGGSNSGATPRTPGVEVGGVGLTAPNALPAPTTGESGGAGGNGRANGASSAAGQNTTTATGGGETSGSGGKADEDEFEAESVALTEQESRVKEAWNCLKSLVLQCTASLRHAKSSARSRILPPNTMKAKRRHIARLQRKQLGMDLDEEREGYALDSDCDNDEDVGNRNNNNNNNNSASAEQQKASENVSLVVRESCVQFLDSVLFEMHAELTRCIALAATSLQGSDVESRIVNQVSIICNLSSLLCKSLPPLFCCGERKMPSAARLGVALSSPECLSNSKLHDVIPECMAAAASLLERCDPEWCNELCASTTTSGASSMNLNSLNCDVQVEKKNASTDTANETSNTSTRTAVTGNRSSGVFPHDGEKGSTVLASLIAFAARCCTTSGQSGLPLYAAHVLQLIHQLACQASWASEIQKLDGQFSRIFDALTSRESGTEQRHFTYVLAYVWGCLLGGTPAVVPRPGIRMKTKIEGSFPTLEDVYILSAYDDSPSGSVTVVRTDGKGGILVDEEVVVSKDALRNVESTSITLPDLNVVVPYVRHALRALLAGEDPVATREMELRGLLNLVLSSYLRLAHMVVSKDVLACEALVLDGTISLIQQFASKSPPKNLSLLSDLYEIGAIFTPCILQSVDARATAAKVAQRWKTAAARDAAAAAGEQPRSSGAGGIYGRTVATQRNAATSSTPAQLTALVARRNPQTQTVRGDAGNASFQRANPSPSATASMANAQLMNLRSLIAMREEGAPGFLGASSSSQRDASPVPTPWRGLNNFSPDSPSVLASLAALGGPSGTSLTQLLVRGLDWQGDEDHASSSPQEQQNRRLRLLTALASVSASRTDSSPDAIRPAMWSAMNDSSPSPSKADLAASPEEECGRSCILLRVPSYLRRSSSASTPASHRGGIVFTAGSSKKGREQGLIQTPSVGPESAVQQRAARFPRLSCGWSIDMSIVYWNSSVAGIGEVFPVPLEQPQPFSRNALPNETTSEPIPLLQLFDETRGSTGPFFAIEMERSGLIRCRVYAHAHSAMNVVHGTKRHSKNYEEEPWGDAEESGVESNVARDTHRKKRDASTHGANPSRDGLSPRANAPRDNSRRSSYNSSNEQSQPISPQSPAYTGKVCAISELDLFNLKPSPSSLPGLHDSSPQSQMNSRSGAQSGGPAWLPLPQQMQEVGVDALPFQVGHIFVIVGNKQITLASERTETMITLSDEVSQLLLNSTITRVVVGNASMEPQDGNYSAPKRGTDASDSFDSADDSNDDGSLLFLDGLRMWGMPLSRDYMVEAICDRTGGIADASHFSKIEHAVFRFDEGTGATTASDDGNLIGRLCGSARWCPHLFFLPQIAVAGEYHGLSKYGDKSDLFVPRKEFTSLCNALDLQQAESVGGEVFHNQCARISRNCVLAAITVTQSDAFHVMAELRRENEVEIVGGTQTLVQNRTATAAVTGAEAGEPSERPKARSASTISRKESSGRQTVSLDASHFEKAGTPSPPHKSPTKSASTNRRKWTSSSPTLSNVSPRSGSSARSSKHTKSTEKETPQKSRTRRSSSNSERKKGQKTPLIPTALATGSAASENATSITVKVMMTRPHSNKSAKGIEDEPSRTYSKNSDAACRFLSPSIVNVTAEQLRAVSQCDSCNPHFILPPAILDSQRESVVNSLADLALFQDAAPDLDALLKTMQKFLERWVQKWDAQNRGSDSLDCDDERYRSEVADAVNLLRDDPLTFVIDVPHISPSTSLAVAEHPPLPFAIPIHMLMGASLHFDDVARNMDNLTLSGDRQMKQVINKFPDTLGNWGSFPLKPTHSWLYVRATSLAKAPVSQFTVRARSIQPNIGAALMTALIRLAHDSQMPLQPLRLTSFINQRLLSNALVSAVFSRNSSTHVFTAQTVTSVLTCWAQHPTLQPFDQLPLSILLQQFHFVVTQAFERVPISTDVVSNIEQKCATETSVAAVYTAMMLAAIRLESTWYDQPFAERIDHARQRLMTLWSTSSHMGVGAGPAQETLTKQGNTENARTSLSAPCAPSTTRRGSNSGRESITQNPSFVPRAYESRVEMVRVLKDAANPTESNGAAALAASTVGELFRCTVGVKEQRECGTWLLSSERGYSAARSAVGFRRGRFYFEVRLLQWNTDVCVGVVAQQPPSDPSPTRTMGRDAYSWCLDTAHHCCWHDSCRAEVGARVKWKGGDVIGILLDLESGTLAFTGDGGIVIDGAVMQNLFTPTNPSTNLRKRCPHTRGEEVYYPAVFFEGSGCVVNFGAAPFARRFPSEYVPVDPTHFDSAGALSLRMLASLDEFGGAIQSAAVLSSAPTPATVALTPVLSAVVATARQTASTAFRFCTSAGRTGPPEVETLTYEWRTSTVLPTTNAEQRVGDTVRFTCGNVVVHMGRWYFEAVVGGGGSGGSPPVVSIGWATPDFANDWSRAKTLGDDALSWAVDGENMVARHNKREIRIGNKQWKEGDVVGCMIDCDAGTIAFTVNGQHLREFPDSSGKNWIFSSVRSPGGYVPVVTCDATSSALVVFSPRGLVYCPSNYSACGLDVGTRRAAMSCLANAGNAHKKNYARDGVPASYPSVFHLAASQQMLRFLTAKTTLPVMSSVGFSIEALVQNAAEILSNVSGWPQNTSIELLDTVAALEAVSVMYNVSEQRLPSLSYYQGVIETPIQVARERLRDVVVPSFAYASLRRSLLDKAGPNSNLKLTVNRRKAISSHAAHGRVTVLGGGAASTQPLRSSLPACLGQTPASVSHKQKALDSHICR